VISNQVDGWQHFVNVAAPAAPALTRSFNPPYSDQWFEAEYTPDHGGRLFTAHRGGGLNVIDVSNPAAPATLTSVATLYHFRGMRYANSGGKSYLYYNETNWGLAVYDVVGGGTSLMKLWDNFANGTNDGNGLEIVGNHIYQFGTPANSPTTRMFKAFGLGNPALPAQVFSTTNTSPVSGNGNVLLRRHPSAPRMLAARFYDGLDLIDVTNPAAPVATKIVPADPSIVCWGAAFFPNSVVAMAYGSAQFGAVRFSWWLFLIVAPAGPPVVLTAGLSPMDIHDVTFDAAAGRAYVVGRDTATLLTGLLHVY
jgi:hypothetical protein